MAELPYLMSAIREGRRSSSCCHDEVILVCVIGAKFGLIYA